MASISPTQRTTKRLREAGVPYDIAETYNHITDRRKDLLGFIDIVIWCPERQKVVGIQVTGGGNGSARRTKILTERRDWALRWLIGGNLIEVHDWVKRKLKRGGKALRWKCRVTPITLEDFYEGGVFS